jgi:hypothetical protein
MALQPRKNEMTRPDGQVSRKPYRTPQLFAYGDIAELTKVSSMVGQNDNGNGKGNDMTGFA